MFCFYLIKNTEVLPLQHSAIGFYNWRDKCLLRVTTWVFKQNWLDFVLKCLTWTNSTLCPRSLCMCFVWISEQTTIIYLRRGANKSLARPGRKQAAFPAFYRTWRFITTFTRVHHLSLPWPNQSIPLPIKLLTDTSCFLPGRAKDLSAPRCTELTD